MAPARIMSRLGSGIAPEVSTSTLTPGNCLSLWRMAPISKSVVSGVGSINRSRSLSSVSSPRATDPKTRAHFSRDAPQRLAESRRGELYLVRLKVSWISARNGSARQHDSMTTDGESSLAQRFDVESQPAQIFFELTRARFRMAEMLFQLPQQILDHHRQLPDSHPGRIEPHL